MIVFSLSKAKPTVIIAYSEKFSAKPRKEVFVISNGLGIPYFFTGQIFKHYYDKGLLLIENFSNLKEFFKDKERNGNWNEYIYNEKTYDLIPKKIVLEDDSHKIGNKLFSLCIRTNKAKTGKIHVISDGNGKYYLFTKEQTEKQGCCHSVLIDHFGKDRFRNRGLTELITDDPKRYWNLYYYNFHTKKLEEKIINLADDSKIVLAKLKRDYVRDI